MENDKRQANNNKKEVQNFFVHAPHRALLPAIVFVHSDAIVHIFLFFYKIRNRKVSFFYFLSYFALAKEIFLLFNLGKF